MDMIQSMTGFGKGMASDGENEIRVELKTLNNRYLDINPRIPKDLSFLEESVRTILKRHIRRGRVELYLTYERGEGASAQVQVDHGLLTQYMRAFGEMEEHGIEQDLTASAMAKLPDVIQLKRGEADEQAVGALTRDALEGAIAGLTEMRSREGAHMAQDIGDRTETLHGMLDQIKERAPQVVNEYKEKLVGRIQELCKDTQTALDETRLESEVAYMADRCDISEEITRLSSHLTEVKKLLESDAAVGRKLDFLIQEINREINTIGSKSSDLKITRLVVDMKSEAERIREQVQNIQ
jgi:uncharacterized protein (TIGR00255 family)